MPRKISNLSQIDPRAELGDDIEIGPFCIVGPNVKIGNGNVLDSHVSIIGHTAIGDGNRFFANSVIGGEPQDISFSGAPTETIIGDNNQFREGVTVNRAAEKEDQVTRVGSNNLLMSNSHVAHNCCVGDHVLLVNGVLLGGHVHVHDRAIISGNAAVHHFSTVGTLAFVAGCARVVTDVPPFMMSAKTDNPTIVKLNDVGMRRSGISEDTIQLVKKAFRLIFRKNKTLEYVKEELVGNNPETIPIELSMLFNFLDAQNAGKFGRGREVIRDMAGKEVKDEVKKAA